MGAPSGDGVVVWRVQPAGRVCLLALGVAAAAELGWVVVDTTRQQGSELAWAVLACVLFALVTWGLLTSAFMYIALTEDDLVIRNFLPRQRRIPWTRVRSVTVGYQGLEVRVRDRRFTVYGWAVQQSNWRAALGRPGRSEVLLQQIAGRAPHVRIG